jgi:apolipoprotein D and lipocalin family protein
MKRTTVLALMLGLVGGVSSWGADRAPEVVEKLDVERYMGLWYAIASIPTSFERKCVRGTTAEYTLLENGRIRVVNVCYDAAGEPDRAVGRAWIPDPGTPTKLKVSFVRFLGLWLFPGDYWIIDLDADYRYAVVGHPSRRYGWILSRTPTLDAETLSGIVERLEAQGYDFADFRMIDQSIHAGEEGPA